MRQSVMKKTLIILPISKFIIPIIIGIGTFGTIGLMISEQLRGIYWSLISAYFLPPLGKESVIPTGIAFGFHPILLALSIAFVDIVVALFLVWNYELAIKIPLIGRFMKKVEQIGQVSSGKYSWIKPLRFIGIVLFVMVPFQGSGGLVGTILGRMIGMKPWNVFLGVCVGAISGSLLVAYFADMIKSVFIQNMLMGMFIVILLLIIGIMIWVYRIMNKKKKNGQ